MYTNKSSTQVLIIDKNKIDYDQILPSIAHEDISIHWEANVRDALLLSDNTFHLIIWTYNDSFDKKLTGNIQLLTQTYKHSHLYLAVHPENLNRAIEMLNFGAFGYLLSPYSQKEIRNLFTLYRTRKQEPSIPNASLERELNHIKKINKHLTLTNDVDGILNQIVESIVTIMGEDVSAVINIYDRMKQRLITRAVFGTRIEQIKNAPPRPHGISNYVTQNSKTLILNDALNNPKAHEIGRDEVQAIMAIPILDQGRAIGSLYIDSIAPRVFKEEDKQIALSFAVQASLAIHKVRTVTSLTEIVTKIPMQMEHRTTLFDAICQTTAQLMDVDSCCILRRVRDGRIDVLRIIGAFGLSSEMKEGTRDEIGKSIAGRAVAHKKPIITNNVPEDDRFDNPAAINDNILAIACVPVWHGDDVIGTLDIHSQTRTNVFSDADLDILELIAHQAAVAIVHAELFERYERLTASVPEGIIGVDERGFIVEFNEQAEQLLGYESDVAATMHISELYTGNIADAREVQNHLLSNERGQIKDQEASFLSADGQEIPIRFSASLHYSANGQPQGSFGYFHDRRQYQAVDELTKSFINAAEEDAICRQIVDILAKNLSADICLLLKYDQRTNDFVIRAISGNPLTDELKRFQIPLNSFIEATLDAQEPNYGVITEDVEIALNHLCEILIPFSRFDKPSHFLTIPLIHQENAIGFLLLLDKVRNQSVTAHSFSSADKTLWTTMGQQIVGLLQRTVYSSSMQALFNISAEIATIYEEKQILQKIVDVLVDVLGYRLAYFRLKDASNKLIICAGSGTTHQFINNPDYNLDIGVGVNGRVAQTGLIEAISDVQNNSDYFYREIALEQGLRGMLVVPIQIDRELIGTLCCYTGQPYFFTKEDKQLLTTFANLTAVTIERVRQFEEINRRASELERLHNISQVISAELSLSEVLNSIVDNVLDLVKARDVHLYLYDAEKDKLTFAASYWNTGERNIQVAGPRINGLTHTVALAAERIIINKPQKHDLFSTQPWPLTAIAGFPLKIGETVVGVINIAFEDEGLHFSAKKVNAIETIASQAAITLANAQLFDETRRQVTELRNLDQTGETLASVMQLDETMSTIAEMASRVTEADGTYVALYDPIRKQFDLDRHAFTGVGVGVAIWGGKQPKENNVIDHILTEEIFCVEDVDALTPEEIHDSGKQALLTSNVHSFVGVRLDIGEKPAGILFFNYKKIFDQWDKSKNEPFLRVFADQAAIAIERAQLFERVEQQNALGRVVAKTMGSLMDPWNTIAKKILEGAVQIVGADRAYISAMDMRTDQFEFVVHLKNGEFTRGARTEVNEKIENLVRVTQKSVLLDDVRKLTWYRDEYLDTAPQLSHLAVPIAREGEIGREVVGVIYLECYRPGAFHLADQELLEDLADQAIIAHHNALSYEDARQQVQNLKLLLEITQWITSFRPIKGELQEMAERLHQLHDFDLVTVNVYDAYQQIFEPPIVVGDVLSMEPKLLSHNGSLKWRRLQEGPDEVFAEEVSENIWLDDPFVVREQIKAAGSIRLRVDNQIVGILGVYKRTPYIFDQVVRDAVRKSAKLASGLIYHSSILQSIVDGLHGVMGFDVITLFLYNAAQKEFSMPVTAGKMLTPKNLKPNGLINDPLWQAIQDNESYFSGDSISDPILAGDFVNREDVQSSGFARLAVDGEIVGVLFVNWRHKHLWTQAEKYAVQLFADGAAIAIQNMQQVNTQEKKQRQLSALYKAGWTVVGAGLDVEAVLETILELAIGETGAHFGTLQLIEPDGEHLSFAAVWPKEKTEELRKRYGRMPISGPGITARAARENDAQLVLDVRLDDDFEDVSGETRSELAVTIRQDGTPLGVLNVEHKAPNAFNDEDRELLIGFTNLAVLALQNAKQYQELDKVKNKQLATQAVAWLGLFGANWQHTINQKIFSISNYTAGLSRWLEKQELSPQIQETLYTVLHNINDVANSIRTVQIPGEVSPDISNSTISQMELDAKLPQIVERWIRRRHDVEIEYQCQCPEIIVSISDEWFQVIMEKLINNALKAMPDGGKITLSTKMHGNMVHLLIKDSGHGIPEYAQRYFLKREIPRRGGEPGSGMGVLIANFIALRHEGELLLLETIPDKGTTLLLKLPVLEEV